MADPVWENFGAPDNTKEPVWESFGKDQPEAKAPVWEDFGKPQEPVKSSLPLRGTHEYDGTPLSDAGETVVDDEQKKQMEAAQQMLLEAGKTNGNSLELATSIKNQFPTLGKASPADLAWYIDHYRQGGKTPVQWFSKPNKEIAVTANKDDVGETIPQAVGASVHDTVKAVGEGWDAAGNSISSMLAHASDALGITDDGVEKFNKAIQAQEEDNDYEHPEGWSRSIGKLIGEAPAMAALFEIAPLEGEALSQSALGRISAGAATGAAYSGGNDVLKSSAEGALGAAAFEPFFAGGGRAADIMREQRGPLNGNPDTAASRIAKFLKSVPASTANALMTAMQGAGYVIDKAAEGADKAYEGSWLDKEIAGITGVHQRPSELIGGIPEAFPLGGEELGGFRNIIPKATPELAARLPKSPAERLAAHGVDIKSLPKGVKPADALKALDEMAAIRQEAEAFKGSTSPNPNEVFKPETTAEEWGKSLGADEFLAEKGTPDPVPDPIEPHVRDLEPPKMTDPDKDEAILRSLGLTSSHFDSPEEMAQAVALLRGKEPIEPVSYEGPVKSDPIPEEAPTLSKKEADAAFNESKKPEPQNAAEWEKSLTEDAERFLKDKEKAQADAGPPIEGTGEAPSSQAEAPLEDPEVSSGRPSSGTLTSQIVEKLTTAINSAASIEAKEQRRLYSTARRERLAKAKALRDQIGGEEGLNASLAALKGELPKAHFDSIRDQFTPDEIRSLFDHVSNNDQLHGFEVVKAQTALRKLLDGELPQASEIKLLDKIFPPSFVKAAMKHRPIMSKLADGAANALNLPRSLMSTFDLSAPFTQGIFLVGRKEFWKSFYPMFKAFGSERSYAAVMDNIRNHPNAPWMEEGGLALTDIHGHLSQKEEQFMSNWAESLPVAGRVVKASERAYTAFLNKLRADTFNSIFEKAKAAGIKPEDDPKFVHDLADFINNATGRGNLGERGNAAAPLLSSVLFSPRLMAARVNMLRPDVYIKMHPEVRKEALKSLLAFGGITTTVLALAQAGGAKVETDPKSSDFAKIRIHNTRYNTLGGFGPYLTLGARMVTAETKTAKGAVKPLDSGKFGQSSRLEVVGNFGRSKLAPTVSFVADYLDGENMVGEPFEIKSALGSRFIPMFLQDWKEVVDEEGLVKGTVMAAPGVLGMSTQTYDENKPRQKKEAETSEEVPAEVKTPVETPDWAK